MSDGKEKATTPQEKQDVRRRSAKRDEDGQEEKPDSRRATQSKCQRSQRSRSKHSMRKKAQWVKCTRKQQWVNVKRVNGDKHAKLLQGAK
jgi:hypothetical protein